MAGPIERFLSADHERLGSLLERAARGAGIDAEAYAEFRRGLLRHIAMEEKVLIPFARERGEVPMAPALRRDHAEIAGLLAIEPGPQVIARLCAVLERHNPIEEGEAGLYALCDARAGDEAEALLARLRAVREARVSPYSTSPRAKRMLGLE
jgi:hypothetical protein